MLQEIARTLTNITKLDILESKALQKSLRDRASAQTPFRFLFPGPELSISSSKRPQTPCIAAVEAFFLWIIEVPTIEEASRRAEIATFFDKSERIRDNHESLRESVRQYLRITKRVREKPQKCVFESDERVPEAGESTFAEA